MQPRQIAAGYALKPYAASDGNSRGRRFKEDAPTYRSEFQRDRDRIIHSAAFRRLEYKTQVFVNHEGDMFRTRLTHSIEVAQIGRSIARVLGLNEDLTESIALAHDLGHTPFGHAGQDALNQCMKNHGGFEHNLQSLRVVDELEEHYAEFSGLNLTFETREGILKHCSQKRAQELGDIGERFIKGSHPGLEAQLVNLADGIAYNNHDVDDGLRSDLISIEQLCEIQLFAEPYQQVLGAYKDLSPRRIIHEVVRRMINTQIVDLVETSNARIAEITPESIQDIRCADQPLFGFSDQMAAQNQELKKFLRRYLYQHYKVRRMSAKADRIIAALFNAFMGDAGLLPPEYQNKIADQGGLAQGNADGVAKCSRVIADYIAGMTDRFAIGEYERMFDPNQLT